eukprot:m.77540 g.77540  ORF g.77540 m.77540 type:complete len:396 (+) comp36043_c0_seq1:575-1762(+)
MESPLEENGTVAALKSARTAPMASGGTQRRPLEWTDGQAAASAQTGKCPRCGYSQDHKRCPAIGKTCLRCKGSGHFKAVCRSKTTEAKVQPVHTGPTEEGVRLAASSVSYSEGAVTTSDEKSFYIGAVDEKGVAWFFEVSTNGTQVNYKLDTGAEVNVLPYEVFRKLARRPKLLKAHTRLFAYTATTPMAVTGQCVCDVEMPNGASRKVRFYVLGEGVKGDPLLGLVACDQLNLVQRGGEQSQEVGSVLAWRSDEVVGQFLDLFNGIGKMEETMYTISLREDARPVALATARRVAYPQYKSVQEELERMKQLDVIVEVTEPAEWCSPMVVVPKSGGAVRICVDYGELNQFVRREHYHLPWAEEIFAKMRGAKFFSTLDAASGFWQIPIDQLPAHH